MVSTSCCLTRRCRSHSCPLVRRRYELARRRALYLSRRGAGSPVWGGFRAQHGKPQRSPARPSSGVTPHTWPWHPKRGVKQCSRLCQVIVLGFLRVRSLVPSLREVEVNVVQGQCQDGRHESVPRGGQSSGMIVVGDVIARSNVIPRRCKERIVRRCRRWR